MYKQNTPTAAGAGFADSFTTLATVKGWLRKTGGSRSLTAGEIESNYNYELILWYQSDLWSALSMKDRIEIGTRRFTINSWERMEEENRFIKIQVTEKRG